MDRSMFLHRSLFYNQPGRKNNSLSRSLSIKFAHRAKKLRKKFYKKMENNSTNKKSCLDIEEK